MKAEQIRSVIHRAPFKALELELDNGRKIAVRHPDFIFFNESGTSAMVTEGTTFELIDVNHIAVVKSKTK